MTRLMRAPEECGSWTWELDGDGGLSSALVYLARVSGVLQGHGLLAPSQLECDWYVPGAGGLALASRLGLVVTLGDPQMAERVLKSRPSGFPDAQVAEMRLLGKGQWVNSDGRQFWEPRLVDLALTPDPADTVLELTVHHDIWKFYNFAGKPQPQIRERNAPGLAAALQEIESVLGVQAMNGEPTYFGVSEGYGIATPEPSPNGMGPNLADRL